jgi:hypothetical protein
LEIGHQETSSASPVQIFSNTSILSATRSLRLAPDINCSTKFVQLQGMYDFLACGSECRNRVAPDVGGRATTKEVTHAIS